MKAIREQVPLGTEQSFSAYRYEGAEFDAPYHFHPEIEVVYIEEGRGIRVVGDHSDSFYPGDLCLFAQNLPHFYHADQAGRRASSLVVQFLPEVIRSLLSTPEMRPVRELLKDGQRGIRFSGNTAEGLHSLILELVSADGPERMLRLLELLTALAGQGERQLLSSIGYTYDADDKQGQRIERAWQLLVTQSSDALTQADVAAAMHMSVSTFSRFFRRATNRTFTEALLEIRLGHACRLLAESDTTISEICYACGFNNLSNFNRQFKKRYGRSPREWRKLF
ncbi:MAG: AraC family transcriptional regulator [Opitutales bacterium]|nr:AraC family transcriptional regulator [Opitutales bacterium]MDP4778077.1 AraC family transcriptional regulator [Opitutales bacterium]